MKNELNFEIISYVSGGMIRRFKVTKINPKNFKVGDKYIVIGSSTTEQTVLSEKNAEKINNSILNSEKIRKIVE